MDKHILFSDINDKISDYYHETYFPKNVNELINKVIDESFIGNARIIFDCDKQDDEISKKLFPLIKYAGDHYLIWDLNPKEEAGIIEVEISSRYLNKNLNELIKKGYTDDKSLVMGYLAENCKYPVEFYNRLDLNDALERTYKIINYPKFGEDVLDGKIIINEELTQMIKEYNSLE